jgi:glyoxylase-like metal-dependent hydrolase (beta-lactamase superfamily II)
VCAPRCGRSNAANAQKRKSLVGGINFSDGSFEALRDAIHKKLFTLPDDTIVYPGHGTETTTGHERRTNPFVGAASGSNY